MILGLVIIGAGLAELQSSILGIIAFRAAWGLANWLFISTTLATIMRSARGSLWQAILPESALELGIAAGPLLGGVLGSISWRGSFFGLAALMFRALFVTFILLPPRLRLTATRRSQSP